MKKDILSCSLSELYSEMESIGEKNFRGKQIYEWLHTKRVHEFVNMSNISSSLRTKLNDNYCINSIKIVRKLESSIDKYCKIFI